MRIEKIARAVLRLFTFLIPNGHLRAMYAHGKERGWFRLVDVKTAEDQKVLEVVEIINRLTPLNRFENWLLEPYVHKYCHMWEYLLRKRGQIKEA